MKIALTGSTGKVGTAILAAARELGLPIRALARDPSKLRSGEEAAHFDFTNPDAHARALEGIGTVILISPATPGQVERDGQVIEAARAAGVSHLIKLTGAGAEDAKTRFAAQHRAAESRIREGGMGWTIVRPTFFMENMLGLAPVIASGTYPAPSANAAMGQIAIADIAFSIATIAKAPTTHRGATYTLTGPAAYTGAELAAALSDAAGHRVNFADVPEDAFRQNLLRVGLDTWTVEGLVEAYQLVRAGDAAPVTDDVRRITARPPTDFATWARQHGAAFRART